MDWTTTNFDWNQAKAFLVTAREGSFSAAAVAMGLTQPTLSRQIAAFEKNLQVVLFEKSSRGLELTPIGAELLEHASRMGEASVDFSLAAAGNSTRLEGNVCISASEPTAAYTLPKIVLQLQQDYPEIRVEILASNTTSDLRKREADIAIRSYRPTQLDLIGKKLGVQRWGLYASNEFLDAHGPLNSLEALERTRFIGMDQADSLLTHLKSQQLGISKNNISFVAGNFLVVIELIKNGAGVGVVPIEIGDTQSGIQRVAERLIQFEVENWLVTHSELRTNRRIRVVYDFLSEALSDQYA